MSFFLKKGFGWWHPLRKWNCENFKKSGMKGTSHWPLNYVLSILPSFQCSVKVWIIRTIKISNITWKDKRRNGEVLARISACKFPLKRLFPRINKVQLTRFGVCRVKDIHLCKTHPIETRPSIKTDRETKEGKMGKRWEKDILVGIHLHGM